MVGIRVVIASISLGCLAACGSKGPPVVAPDPEPKTMPKKPDPPPETEEDRAQRRHTVALTLVPENSSCLPLSLKDSSAPRLDLAAVGIDAVVCAVDTDPARLLGPVGCWKVDLKSGALTYYPPAPLPSRGFDALFDDNCVRGYCLPRTATVPANKTAHLVWNLDSTKVAVLAGDDVHIFDAAARSHLSTFSVRGDKGVTNEPTAIHWVGDTLLVEGTEGPFAGVWVYKLDGTPVGPIEPIGSKDGKPISTFGGSFSILDDKRVALAEQGFSALTVYEVGTSRRTRQVRKIPKVPCKPDELDAYWKNTEVTSQKCKDALIKNFSSLIGAEAVAGKTSLLVMMRGSRLGELAVLDMQTLAEKKAIKLPWCSAPAN